MTVNLLPAEKGTSISCSTAHLGESRISLRCSSGFASSLRVLIDEGGEDFGGVSLVEKGSSWYDLVPREKLVNGKKVDPVLKSVFLLYAFSALKRLIARLDASAKSNEHRVVHETSLISVGQVVVSSPPSTAYHPPRPVSHRRLISLQRKFS